MKSSVSSVALIILFFTRTATSIEFNEANYYGHLIKEVHNEYHSAGVIGVSATNPIPFESMTFWHEVTNMLASEGISTSIGKFNMLRQPSKNPTRSDHGKLLMVTILTSTEELSHFQLFRRTVNTEYLTWFILFSSNADPMNDVCEFCQLPNNSLSLKFNTNMIISCCERETLTEWWSGQRNSVAEQTLGRVLDDNLTIAWHPNPIPQRRRPLEGRSLRVAIVQTSSLDAAEIVYDMYLREVMATLLESVNCTASETIDEMTLGAWDSARLRWTGGIGRIHENKSDLVIAELMMSPERKTAVQFTSSMHISPIQLHLRKSGWASFVWNACFKGFDTGVWTAIIALIVVTPIFINAIRHYETRSPFLPHLSDCYLIVWSIFCSQCSLQPSGKVPLRIFHLSLLLLALILSNVHSGSMFRNLAVAHSSPPFTTLDEFLADGSYKLILLKDSPYIHLFQSLNNSLLTTPSLMPLDSFPTDVTQAFHQVCDGKVGFLGTERMRTDYESSMACELTSINTGRTEAASMIVSRGSEYLDVISYHIERLAETGVFQRLRYKYWPPFVDAEEQGHSPVQMQQILSVICIPVVGTFIGLTVLIIERSYETMSKWRAVKKTSTERPTKKRRTMLVPTIYPYHD